MPHESEDATSAQVVLHGEAPQPVTSRGRARRELAHPEVPEVGDEVAAGRAPRGSGDRLMGLASDHLAAADADKVRQPHPAVRR